MPVGENKADTAVSSDSPTERFMATHTKQVFRATSWVKMTTCGWMALNETSDLCLTARTGALWMSHKQNYTVFERCAGGDRHVPVPSTGTDIPV